MRVAPELKNKLTVTKVVLVLFSVKLKTIIT